MTHGSTNLSSFREFNGRALELHRLLKLVADSSVKAINVYGNARVGKTSPVKELSKLLTGLLKMINNVVYIDFSNYKSMRDC